jgi:hypothetical protein
VLGEREAEPRACPNMPTVDTFDDAQRPQFARIRSARQVRANYGSGGRGFESLPARNTRTARSARERAVHVVSGRAAAPARRPAGQDGTDRRQRTLLVGERVVWSAEHVELVELGTRQPPDQPRVLEDDPVTRLRSPATRPRAPSGHASSGHPARGSRSGGSRLRAVLAFLRA